MSDRVSDLIERAIYKDKEPLTLSQVEDLPDMARALEAELARLRELVEKQGAALRGWHTTIVDAILDTEHRLKDERNGMRMALAIFHADALLMAALKKSKEEQNDE